MNTISFLSPVPPSLVTEHRLAPRLDHLAGRRIGLLDNRKANAGALLASVAGELTGRHPDVEFVTEHKLASAAAPDEVMGRLQSCHAVVLAIAD
jgi:hypothetical protein